MKKKFFVFIFLFLIALSVNADEIKKEEGLKLFNKCPNIECNGIIEIKDDFCTACGTKSFEVVDIASFYLQSEIFSEYQKIRKEKGIKKENDGFLRRQMKHDQIQIEYTRATALTMEYWKDNPEKDYIPGLLVGFSSIGTPIFVSEKFYLEKIFDLEYRRLSDKK